jgi:hypothetical protein
MLHDETVEPDTLRLLNLLMESPKLFSIPKSITYFDEADDSPNPDCLLGLTWEEVKNKIRLAVCDYLRYFFHYFCKIIENSLRS